MEALHLFYRELFHVYLEAARGALSRLPVDRLSLEKIWSRLQ